MAYKICALGFRITIAVLLTTCAFAQYAVSSSALAYPATVPLMGDAGSCITDPGFNSTICAVTDANTDPAHPNTPFTTTDYSGLNAWNSGATAFYFLEKGGIWVAQFDSSHGTVTSLKRSGFGDLAHAEYSFTNPTTITGALAYPLIRQWKHGVETTIRDVRKDYNLSQSPTLMILKMILREIVTRLWLGLSRTSLGSSTSGTKAGLQLPRYANTDCDRPVGEKREIDPSVPSPAPGVAPTPILPFYMHHAALSRDGRWAVLDPGKDSTPERLGFLGNRNQHVRDRQRRARRGRIFDFLRHRRSSDSEVVAGLLGQPATGTLEPD